jgi:hypothetical protein
VTAYDDFLASPVAVRERGNWLAELHLEDDTDTEEVLRYSSRGFATAPGDTPANTNYPRRVIDGPRIETSLWRRGQIGGGSVPSFGTIKLNNMDGGLDQYHPSTGYRWDGRQITILYGEGKGWTLEMDYADFGVPFEGRMGEPIYRSDGTVEVPLKGLEDQFEDPLSERVYRGTDWLLEWSVTGIAPFGAVTTTKLDITGDITIEGWLYLDTFSTGGGIYTTAGGGATLKPWGVVVTSTRELRFNYTWNSGTNVNHTMTAVMGTKKWYHWAIRVDGTAGTFLLWDEDAQTETVETFTAASATRDGADGNCQLGSPSGNTTWHDEFRLWNDARDLDFIRANRHSELDTVPAACVHYLKFNEGTGTTVSDSAASPINSSTLTGTYQWLSALEGQADLAGTAKPDAFGRVYNVTPVLVDAATYTYQVAGAGEIEDIVNVYEGGNDLTRDTAQTDLRTFVTTTPTAGQYDSLDLHGMIKLGSKPTLPITVKVKGYLNASSTYVESAATIARHIVTDRGDNPLADPGDLDTASFTALETANDSIVGLYVSNPTELTIGGALDFILGSVGAWWGYERGSPDFKVARFEAPAATADHDFDETSIVSVSPLKGSTKYWKVVVKYHRNYTPMDTSQLAGVVVGTDDESKFRESWRKKDDKDDDFRDDHQGAGVLEVETGLWSSFDAKDEATRLLALYANLRGPWKVELKPVAGAVTIDETVSLTVHLDIPDIDYAGLDGTGRYRTVTVGDAGGDGEIDMEVWGV